MLFSARIQSATLAMAVAIGLAATPALAQNTPLADMPAGVYASDPTHTSVTFKVSHIGLSHYTARFAKVDAELAFDPADVTKSTVKATIDPASIRTDYPNPEKEDFDKKLATSSDWFNAGAHPSITFSSTKLEKTGDKTGKLTGDLTFLGVTKPVTLDVTFNGAYPKAPFSELPALGFSATTTIKRSEWGFSTYVPNIGDDVQILIETEFHKKG